MSAETSSSKSKKSSKKMSKRSSEPSVKAPPVPEAKRTSTRSVVGKRWRGQKHWAITTPAKVAALNAERAPHEADPNAVTIEAYFINRGIRDPVRQAAMKTYTNLRKARMDVFDKIFETF